MQCPHCPDTALQMTDRQGIEIDYCPKCRGVWLDRGELDKLIERSAQAAPPAQQAYQPPHPSQSHPHPSSWQGHHPRKKHKSWLSEIFD